MGILINSTNLKIAGKSMSHWFNSQDEAQKLIFRHSCIGGAIALIPIPVVGEIAVIVNQIAMYRGINKLVGISFSQSVLKNIGKFLLSQAAGAIGGMAALFGVGAAVKFIPGLNFIAGFAQAPVAGVANYICGIVYFNMLGGFMEEGGSDGLSDDEIIRRMKAHSPSDSDIRSVKADAQRKMKDADYSSFKAEAQACADEAKNNQSDYQ